MKDGANVMNCNDAELAACSFCIILERVIQHATEVKTIIPNIKRSKWITGGLINSIKVRDKMKKRLIELQQTR